MFATPSLLKYALTVAAPAIALLLFTMERPLRLAVALLIVSIPFGGAKATLAGQHVSLLTVTVVLSAVVAIVSGPRPRMLGGTGIAGVGAIALLVGPLLVGSNTGLAVLLGAMVLVAWLTSRVAREGEGALTSIYWSVATAALLQAVIAIYEYKTNHRLNLYGSAGNAPVESEFYGTAAGGALEQHTTQRPAGTLYDPISLGNILAVSCPIILILVLRCRVLIARVSLIVAGIVIALALALSFSRFSWIAAIAGTTVTCLALPRPKLRAGALAGVVAILAIASGLAIATVGTRLVSRVETISNPTHAANRITARGDRTREETWTAATQIFFHNPVAGVGLGRIRFALARYLPNIQQSANAQSTYLQVAAEAGALGLLALLLILGSIAWSITRGLRQSRLMSAALLGAWIATLIVWVTDVTIRYTPVAAFLAILIGVASALPCLSAPEASRIYEIQ